MEVPQFKQVAGATPLPQGNEANTYSWTEGTSADTYDVALTLLFLRLTFIAIVVLWLASCLTIVVGTRKQRRKAQRQVLSVMTFLLTFGAVVCLYDFPEQPVTLLLRCACVCCACWVSAVLVSYLAAQSLGIIELPVAQNNTFKTASKDLGSPPRPSGAFNIIKKPPAQSGIELSPQITTKLVDDTGEYLTMPQLLPRQKVSPESNIELWPELSDDSNKVPHEADMVFRNHCIETVLSAALGMSNLCKVLITPFLNKLNRVARMALSIITFDIAPKPLGKDNWRLEWTCRCGHRSHDDFQELIDGSVTEFATTLIDAGYITHARVTQEVGGKMTGLISKVNNALVGARRRVSGLRSSLLPVFSTKSTLKSIALQCLPAQKCRWLHMCLKKRPYATKLAPLHLCKNEAERELTDAVFFQALRKAFFSQRSWTEKILFKLKKIEFVEFELCPDDFVDHIIADKIPPTTEDYDFEPPPPPKKVPPIGPEHMLHLFSNCGVSPSETSLYLRHIPKRRNAPLCFQPDIIEGNTGWGLHFIEVMNSSLAVTVLFGLSLLLGVVFAVCWTVWKKDIQGAFSVAAYLTSVMTLAVTTWQMWSV